MIDEEDRGGGVAVAEPPVADEPVADAAVEPKRPYTRRKRAKGRARGRAKAEASDAKAKSKKGGPRPFPKVPLSKALEIAQKIKELNGGEPWKSAQVAAALGMGARGDDFYYVTASSRDFGITVGTRDTETIELTALGRAIVYPPNA